MAAYIFTSERLGFRNWQSEDLDNMAAINADPEVMQFFPDVQTKNQTQVFIERMQAQFAAQGYCYFAVEELRNAQLIGFIGLSNQTFEADFTPCTDIGWRLVASAWRKSYAAEGAKRCLEYAFKVLNPAEVWAVAPQINTPSVKVMEKLLMKKHTVFNHPLLKAHKNLQPCVAYVVKRKDWLKAFES